MAFTTFGQETEWTLFLQPRNPHGAACGCTGPLYVCHTDTVWSISCQQCTCR